LVLFDAWQSSVWLPAGPAEHVLPDYYSPAMVAPQVKAVQCTTLQGAVFAVPVQI
jgi:hypothetical protein